MATQQQINKALIDRMNRQFASGQKITTYSSPKQAEQTVRFLSRSSRSRSSSPPPAVVVPPREEPKEEPKKPDSIQVQTYQVEGQRATQKEYDSYVQQLQQRDKAYRVESSVPSEGVKRFQEYNPAGKVLGDVNPETGRTIISRQQFLVDDKEVTKKEQEAEIKKRLKKGDSVLVTKTEPQFWYENVKDNIVIGSDSRKPIMYDDVDKNMVIQRTKDSAGNVIMISGGALGYRSVFAEKGEFFPEENIRAIEVEATQRKKLFELLDSKEKTSRADEVLAGAETFIGKGFKKVVGDVNFKEIGSAFSDYPLKKPITKTLDWFKDKQHSVDKEQGMFGQQGVPLFTLSQANKLTTQLIRTPHRKEDGSIMLASEYNFKKYEEWRDVANVAVTEFLEKSSQPESTSKASLIYSGGKVLVLGTLSDAHLTVARITDKPVTSAVIVGAGVMGYSVAPFVVKTASVGLIGYDSLTRATSEEKIQSIFGSVGTSALLWGVPKAFTRLATKLDPGYSKLTTDSLGRQTVSFKIDDVSSGVKRDLVIDMVPEGTKGLMTSLDAQKVIKEFGRDIPFRKSPSIPDVSPVQRAILETIREPEIRFSTDTSIGGSFAQKVLVKGGRKFGDLDIVTDDPVLFSMRLKEKLGDAISVKEVKITDSPLGEFSIFKVAERTPSGKLVGVADIDPLRFAEEGFASKFGTRAVSSGETTKMFEVSRDGLKFKGVMAEDLSVTSIESRFVAKLQQATRGKVTDKVVQDVNILSGGKINVDAPAFKGAYGWSLDYQAKFADSSQDLISAQQSLFPRKLLGGTYSQDVVIRKPGFEGSTDLEASFFASPPDPQTGRLQLRGTRLGVDNRASPSDLLSGNFQFGRGTPQAVVFPSAKVGGVPAELKPLLDKARKGDSVAQAEFFSKYKDYQMTPSGEFKPFGYPGSEIEVTLAPGEVIKGTGKLGVTLVNDKRVAFIGAEVVKTKDVELVGLQKKFVDDSISVSEQKKLKFLLEREFGSSVDKPVVPLSDVGSGFVVSSKLVSSSVVSPVSSVYDNVYSFKGVPGVESKVDVSKVSVVSKVVSSVIYPSVVSSRVSSGVVRGVRGRVSSPESSVLSRVPVSQSLYGKEVRSSPRVSDVSSRISSPVSRDIITRIHKEQIRTPPPRMPSYFRGSSKKSSPALFDVFVRRRGEFKRVSGLPLDYSEAKGLGASVVGSTAAATFKIKPTGLAGSKQGRFAGRVNNLGDFYTKQDKKGLLFIEKREKRISTPGELREITYKGLQAIKSKKLKGLGVKLKNKIFG